MYAIGLVSKTKIFLASETEKRFHLKENQLLYGILKFPEPSCGKVEPVLYWFCKEKVTYNALRTDKEVAFYEKTYFEPADGFNAAAGPALCRGGG